MGPKFPLGYPIGSYRTIRWIIATVVRAMGSLNTYGTSYWSNMNPSNIKIVEIPGIHKYTRDLHGCGIAIAGTHASGRAGEHFELSDSILDIRVKKVTPHTIIAYAYSM